jgi:hypothetical protein
MNTKQIKYVIKKDPITSKKFGGVFAENRLPRSPDFYPCGYIANTDPSNEPGKHWVAFYLQSPTEGEFFDSYGHQPQFYGHHFVEFLNQNSKRWSFNKKELQSAFTAVCGEYCIFYLMHRARGVRMSSIVRLFNPNKLRNDHSVYEFVMKNV